MRILFYLPVLLSIAFVSCKKDHALLKKPHAMMSVSAYGGFGTTYLDTAFIIGTHDALVLHNISENADSINWNLGNGVSTNQHDVLLTYDKPGKYTVVLTAFNKDGIKSQAFKNFTVKERILKSFSINNININDLTRAQSGLPVFSKINLWLEVKFSQSNKDSITTNSDVLAPLVYRSPVFNDIDSSFHGTLSYILNDTPKIIINYPVKNVDYTSSGLGLIINLYGQENNKKYLLGSNFWSGVGIYFPDGANPARFNDYEMITSFNWSGTNIKLNCEFQ